MLSSPVTTQDMASHLIQHVFIAQLPCALHGIDKTRPPWRLGSGRGRRQSGSQAVTPVAVRPGRGTKEQGGCNFTPTDHQTPWEDVGDPEGRAPRPRERKHGSPRPSVGGGAEALRGCNSPGSPSRSSTPGACWTRGGEAAGPRGAPCNSPAGLRLAHGSGLLWLHRKKPLTVLHN